MINILRFFKPSWKKIVVTFVLSIFTAVVIYLFLARMMDCMFSWGCDTMTLGTLFVNLLATVLVAPAYYFLGFLGFFFRHIKFLEKGNAWLFVFGFFEIIYLYLLGCILSFVWARHKGNNQRWKNFRRWARS